MRDLHNQIKAKRAISPVSTSDDTPLVSQIIDLQGFESLEFIIALGSIADANMTAVVLVEEGDASNLSDAAAVADADLLGTENGAAFQFDDDNEMRKIGYRGTKGYVRVTITPSGNGSAALLAVIAILGNPRDGLQTAQAT